MQEILIRLILIAHLCVVAQHASSSAPPLQHSTESDQVGSVPCSYSLSLHLRIQITVIDYCNHGQMQL